MLVLYRVLLLLSFALAFSACAPTVMSADRFPIKPGDPWTLSFADPSPQKISREFTLRGSPSRKADYIAYEGSSGDDDIIALLTDSGILLVVLYLDNKPEDQQTALHCLLRKDFNNFTARGNAWKGNGFVGTEKAFGALGPGAIFDYPTCVVQPK